MARPETRVFKVTEASTGKIAAFARWKFPHVAATEEKEELEKSEEEKKSEWPVGTNIALCEEKFGMLDVWREQFVVDTESIYGSFGSVYNTASAQHVSQQEQLTISCSCRIFSHISWVSKKGFGDQVDEGGS